jgi:aspartate aminotransferase
MRRRVHTRLAALHRGIRARSARRAGGLHSSAGRDLSRCASAGGRKLDGKNDRNRRADSPHPAERAGIAVVPFQAFGLGGQTGWFRLSVGAVSVAEIDAAMPRLEALLSHVV